MQKRSSAPLWIVCILLLLVGCTYIPFLSSSRKSSNPVTEIKQPTTTPPLVTPETLPSPTVEAGALALTSKTLHESEDAPRYEIDARWPLLEGEGNHKAATFNQAAERFAIEQVRLFKENLYGLPDDPLFDDAYSSLTIDFVPTYEANGIFAVLFHISFYSAGAAHPGSYSHAINYDLRTEKVLALEDLFLPDADYMNVISHACIEDLKTRQVLEWEEGALPSAENYQVWNITPQGLLVTFDEYRVASYAAGPQSVVVPYTKLMPILRPDGPLREYQSH
jgi:hypothetical protein